MTKGIINNILVCIAFLLTGPVLNAQFVDLHWVCLAYYPFTNAAHDISGQGNHGTVYGAMTTGDYTDSAGSAYCFDGVDDFIDCGNGLASISSAVTVSCWIRTDTATDNSHIVSKYDYISDGGFILGTQNGAVKWAGRNGSGQFIRITSSNRIDDNQWHCIVGMVEGEIWSLFVDGILENRVLADQTGTGLTANTPLYIGCYYNEESGNKEHFKGSIDNVIIHGRALNECELEFLFTHNSFGPR